MSQEPYKNDNKTKLPKFSNRPPSGDGEPPRKGPRFSIYWVYAIIFAVLIGAQFFNSFSSSTAEVNPNQFKQMLVAGDVQKYTIISNRNLVRVKLTEASLSKYEGKIGKNLKASDEYHARFTIASVESFKDDMREFYNSNPQVADVGTAASDANWFSPILQTLLPILIFIGLWILLMRKILVSVVISLLRLRKILQIR
ncbi:MAG: ATP-dependent metallopeptidase FtsH/Yme1/Tma family protein [Bacteroidota bacterium]